MDAMGASVCHCRVIKSCMDPISSVWRAGIAVEAMTPALQTLDIGSIQDLMTLQWHTLAPMASIYNSANLNVGWDSCEILILRDHGKGGSWGGYMASTAIPALQTLDIGSIQDLMTLQWHTLAPMASIYNSANLNVGWDSCKISILRDHEFQSIKVVVGVNTWPQLLSQLFKHLI